MPRTKRISTKNKSRSPGKTIGKYKAIPVGKYRSKLELYAATKLQNSEINFKYEPVSVELLPALYFPKCVERYGKNYKVVKNVRAITYTPDFVGDN